MLLSMTGHGQATVTSPELTVSVEIRSVNSRYLNFNMRGSEAYSGWEAKIEPIVRRYLQRGSVTMNLRLDRVAAADDYQINQAVLASYQRQLQATSNGEAISIASLLALPGVVVDRHDHYDLASEWPVIEKTVLEAIECLQTMRTAEGRAMAADLQANCKSIADNLVRVKGLAPRVREDYQNRLVERLNRLLEKHDINVTPGDVIREVGIFADRCDISEEIVRLASHLEQFQEIVLQPDSVGKKLEFLIQEMFREANTIGSKANDAEIAKYVVEIKTNIERMREMVQNVE